MSSRSNSDPSPGGGWNDPPLFAFEPGTQTVTSKRSFLNKRVPFPQDLKMENDAVASSVPAGTLLPTTLGGKSQNVTTLSPVVCPAVVCSPDLPPPSCLPPISSSETHPESETNGAAIEMSDDTALPYVIDMLESSLEKCLDTMPKRNVDEVSRRLSFLKVSWEDKLSTPVKKKLFQIANEMKNENYQMAYDIHQQLMVDHVSEVSSWMVGVKHVICELRQRTLEVSKGVDLDDHSAAKSDAANLESKRTVAAEDVESST